MTEQQRLEQENLRLRERVKAMEQSLEERTRVAAVSEAASVERWKVLEAVRTAIVPKGRYVDACEVRDAIWRLLPEIKRVLGGKTGQKHLEADRVMEQENQQLREELEDNERTFEMHHRRTVQADRLWQEAHGNSKVYPDLGQLIDWLLERAEQAEWVAVGVVLAAEGTLERGEQYDGKPIVAIERVLELRERAEQTEARQQEQERITLRNVGRLHQAERQLAEVEGRYLEPMTLQLRKEFLALPMDWRRRILSYQSDALAAKEQLEEVQTQLAASQAQVQEYWTLAEDMRTRAEDVGMQLAQAREALTLIQHGDTAGLDGPGYCPNCGERDPRHRDTCTVALVLAATPAQAGEHVRCTNCGSHDTVEAGDNRGEVYYGCKSCGEEFHKEQPMSKPSYEELEASAAAMTEALVAARSVVDDVYPDALPPIDAALATDAGHALEELRRLRRVWDFAIAHYHSKGKKYHEQTEYDLLRIVEEELAALDASPEGER